MVHIQQAPRERMNERIITGGDRIPVPSSCLPPCLHDLTVGYGGRSPFRCSVDVTLDRGRAGKGTEPVLSQGLRRHLVLLLVVLHSGGLA